MGSPAYLLSLAGDSRARLLCREGVYRHALASRQLLRAATRPTVCDRAFCMALNLGLDNRSLLPPFMPVQRNQDGIFAALLGSCFGDGYFGFLPWLLLHRPPVPRPSPGADLWASAARLSAGHLVQVLVRSAAPAAADADAGKNLRALGATLTAWGGMPPADFEEWVRLQVWVQVGRQASQLASQLRQYGAQPAFWADDVKRLLAVWREVLPRQDYVLPWDLVERFGASAARQLLRRLVRRLGQLLRCWPDMVEAAKELRAGGLPLAGKL
jgi:hypothetical protein